MFNLTGLRYDNRYKQNINYDNSSQLKIQQSWMPRVHNGMQVYSPAEYFDVRTYGTSNDQIILIEGVEPVLYGRFPAGGKSWNDVEQWVARSFSTPYSILNATNQNPNRHIDYQRFFFTSILCVHNVSPTKKNRW
jgi:hypothetical protein